ncbi:molybdenum cofactor guanylyltransferase [Thalassomonas sp. RHCl1]|uniref:molybdenum cofactor guanylyltransferase n=1 Tax=Thalassomonas sp. RHCl1 TaxID=2995320 RepID=UPI00248C90FC|nr:molybdenum cofactor guanylyltransferase [Thalassomonas sp. RHCl1]
MKASLANSGCLGVVLAGGLSSRMGENKAKLMRGNTDMLSFSKQLLTDIGIKDIVVSGNNYQVPDIIANGGPVAGIYSVLQHYRPAAILALPVDLPLMTASALSQLKIKGELSQKACFFQGHNIPLYLPNNGYVELFMSQAFAKNTAAIPKEHSQGKKSGPSFKALLNQVPHTSVVPDKTSHLFNTNTPEQWQQAKARFK